MNRKSNPRTRIGLITAISLIVGVVAWAIYGSASSPGVPRPGGAAILRWAWPLLLAFTLPLSVAIYKLKRLERTLKRQPYPGEQGAEVELRIFLTRESSSPTIRRAEISVPDDTWLPSDQALKWTKGKPPGDDSHLRELFQRMLAGELRANGTVAVRFVAVTVETGDVEGEILTLRLPAVSIELPRVQTIKVRLATAIASRRKQGHVHGAGTEGILIERLGESAWIVEVGVRDSSLIGGAWFETLDARSSELQLV